MYSSGSVKPATQTNLGKIVASSRKDWAMKLDDALWAYRSAFNTHLVLTLTTSLRQNLPFAD
jgi:hypothetical protein